MPRGRNRHRPFAALPAVASDDACPDSIRVRKSGSAAPQRSAPSGPEEIAPAQLKFRRSHSGAQSRRVATYSLILHILTHGRVKFQRVRKPQPRLVSRSRAPVSPIGRPAISGRSLAYVRHPVAYLTWGITPANPPDPTRPPTPHTP